jgi:aspartyl-tRNA(Asn)/glutamyl-tRNA(Gln) amidotransferase subunit B
LIELGASEADARTLVEAGLAAHATAATALAKHADGKAIVNWEIGDVLGYLNETNLSVEVLPLTPDALAELADLVADGTLSRNQAKDVLDECLREPKRPKQVVEERGLTQVSDEGELAQVIDDIITNNPEIVAEYKSGDDKAKKKKQGFLMGEAMKATKGQGNPQLLTRLLQERLQS